MEIKICINLRNLRDRADNERYAMHTWLIRLGMIGDDFRETRKVIMSQLGGNMAFRTAYKH